MRVDFVTCYKLSRAGIRVWCWNVRYSTYNHQIEWKGGWWGVSIINIIPSPFPNFCLVIWNVILFSFFETSLFSPLRSTFFLSPWSLFHSSFPFTHPFLWSLPVSLLSDNSQNDWLLRSFDWTIRHRERIIDESKEKREGTERSDSDFLFRLPLIQFKHNIKSTLTNV